MKAILGRKLGMSQTFSKTGEVIPVTLILAEKNTITLRRNTEKEGYEAVQLALPTGRKAPSEQKQTPNALKRMYAVRKEFRGSFPEDIAEVEVGQFTEGDVVEISGTSKGKGFQGVVKRHGFSGGPASHGHRHWERGAGSIGGRFPQHVRKGKKMAGRMGVDRVTVKNLTIVSVDVEKNLLAVKGAVPGPRGGIVEIRAIEGDTNE